MTSSSAMSQFDKDDVSGPWRRLRIYLFLPYKIPFFCPAWPKKIGPPPHFWSRIQYYLVCFSMCSCMGWVGEEFTNVGKEVKQFCVRLILLQWLSPADSLMGGLGVREAPLGDEIVWLNAAKVIKAAQSIYQDRYHWFCVCVWVYYLYPCTV